MMDVKRARETEPKQNGSQVNFHGLSIRLSALGNHF